MCVCVSVCAGSYCCVLRFTGVHGIRCVIHGTIVICSCSWDTILTNTVSNVPSLRVLCMLGDLVLTFSWMMDFLWTERVHDLLRDFRDRNDLCLHLSFMNISDFPHKRNRRFSASSVPSASLQNPVGMGSFRRFGGLTWLKMGRIPRPCPCCGPTIWHQTKMRISKIIYTQWIDKQSLLFEACVLAFASRTSRERDRPQRLPIGRMITERQRQTTELQESWDWK